MVHFTCDLCGKKLKATTEPRFVVKISVYPGHDPDMITEEDLDVDHMESLADHLQNEAERCSNSTSDEFQGFRFDLCPNCRKKFVKDPMGKDELGVLDFSQFSDN